MRVVAQIRGVQGALGLPWWGGGSGGSPHGTPSHLRGQEGSLGPPVDAEVQ